MSKKITYPCLNCHGTGWYDAPRKWGCFRCGGLQYPSKQGSGVDPISNALYILDKIFIDWILINEAIDKTTNLMGWSRKFTVDYLNWMYLQGFIFIEDNKAIDRIRIQDEQPSAL